MIRDLVSQSVLSAAIVAQTLNNSSVNSGAIDLSEGSTGAIQISLDSAAAASATLVLETSPDGSNWTVDDGSTGNGFVDAAGVAVVSPVVAFPALVIAQVVNPRLTNQFARVVITETATQALLIAGIGWVGPVRLTDPES